VSRGHWENFAPDEMFLLVSNTSETQITEAWGRLGGWQTLRDPFIDPLKAGLIRARGGKKANWRQIREPTVAFAH